MAKDKTINDVNLEEIINRLNKYRGKQFTAEDVKIILKDIDCSNVDENQIISVLYDLDLIKLAHDYEYAVGYPSNALWEIKRLTTI